MKKIGFATRFALCKKVVPLFANLAFATARNAGEFDFCVFAALAATKVIVAGKLKFQMARLTVFAALRRKHYWFIRCLGLATPVDICSLTDRTSW